MNNDYLAYNIQSYVHVNFVTTRSRILLYDKLCNKHF